ncbi:uncharacterized protein LOC113859597 [Abrus precatorius]|uniref:Uncharacterized protein LOC113859597 n=1 Tax=Abrus precatorius TaxID=3816 RepID=A0A8B8KXP5_ABRPR|nr:uncharacterized protein LOC113859597 [Abrus precatorius]
MIKEKMKAAQDRQKSYYDRRRKPLEFQVGDHVFFKVLLVTGVGRALKSRKLSPKFIGPFEVLSRIGPVVKYVPDLSHVIDLDSVQVRKDLSYDVYPVRIVDHYVKQLRGKKISLMKGVFAVVRRPWAKSMKLCYSHCSEKATVEGAFLDTVSLYRDSAEIKVQFPLRFLLL